jgi:Glycosyl transferase family 2
MSSRPSVSVVIPTYNRAEVLEDAIASVLGQTVPAIEVIVVDDASTDATPEVVAGFGDAVQYVRQDRSGGSAARNLGASRARKLERQLALHEATPDPRWSVTDCLVVDAAGVPVGGEQGFRRVFVAATEFSGSTEQLFARHLARQVFGTAGGEHLAFTGDFFELLFRGNLALPSTALIQRKAWHDVGGFDPSFAVAQDAEFFHRLAARHRGGVLLDRLTRYRLGHELQVSVPARSAEKIRNALRSGEVAAALRQPLSPSAQEAFADGRRRLLRRLAWTHLANFQPGEAREAIRAYRAAGGTWDAGILAWLGLAILPAGALRALHAAKRALAGRAPA